MKTSGIHSEIKIIEYAFYYFPKSQRNYRQIITFQPQYRNTYQESSYCRKYRRNDHSNSKP